jgi:hypothetical protein
VPGGRKAVDGQMVKVGKMSKGQVCSSQQGGQGLAVTTGDHLLFPIFILCTFATGTAEKPAQMPRLKFPGRAFLFATTLFQNPAVRALGPNVPPLVHQEKVELTFDMNGDGPPALFVTLYSLEGNP